MNSEEKTYKAARDGVVIGFLWVAGIVFVIWTFAGVIRGGLTYWARESGRQSSSTVE